MEKSKQYNKTKLLINLISNFANIFLMYILGFSKIYESIENSENFISLLQYIGVTFFVIWLINIPFGYYSGYYLEKKYQLSNENNLDWIKRQLKSFVLGIILGGVIFIMIRYFLFYAKEHWWIYVFIFMICFNILLGMLAPVIIFPLFYKFEPLENEDLETKIFDLAKKGNVKIKSILRFNMSKETKKANAAFTGIGKTKRIIIGDTLLDEFTEDEIVAVFAHEQGHLVKKHILKMIFISSIVLLISLYLISFYKFADYSLYSNVYKILFFLMLMQNATMVFDNWYSRRNEKEADLYAKEILGSQEGLVSALEKLEMQNLSDPEPSKIVEFLFYSHPAIKTRIKYLESEV